MPTRIGCLLLVSILLVAASDASEKISVASLRYLGKYNVPYHKVFKGTTIGGLSGIDYDSHNDLYYLICDDRSALHPARFYTAKIYLSAAGIDSVQFQDVHSLRQANGSEYPNFKTDPAHTPDPEAIRLNAATGQLVWTSEGERIVKDNSVVLQNPSITIITSEGNYVDSIPTPTNTRMHATEQGCRQNGGFEGLSFTPDYKTLFYNVEIPLFEDGPEASTTDTNPWVRIYRTDATTGVNTAQYAYHLEPVAFPADPATAFKINGVADVLAINDTQLLTVERSFSMGRLACTVKVFLTDLANADNIISVASLKQNPPAHPAIKKLILNMDDLGIYIDNIEGVTFGPDLPNGHHTLIFVSDDNFQMLEKTQFLLFEILGKH